jgi:hypothetical protein
MRAAMKLPLENNMTVTTIATCLAIALVIHLLAPSMKKAWAASTQVYFDLPQSTILYCELTNDRGEEVKHLLVWLKEHAPWKSATKLYEYTEAEIAEHGIAMQRHMYDMQIEHMQIMNAIRTGLNFPVNPYAPAPRLIDKLLVAFQNENDAMMAKLTFSDLLHVYEKPAD